MKHPDPVFVGLPEDAHFRDPSLSFGVNTYDARENHPRSLVRHEEVPPKDGFTTFLRET